MILRTLRYFNVLLRSEKAIARRWEKYCSLAKLEADGTVKMVSAKYGVDDWAPPK
jgi:hypothetical protein